MASLDDDNNNRVERERVSDFVETVTFPCVYMSIVRYGYFCIG